MQYLKKVAWSVLILGNSVAFSGAIGNVCPSEMVTVPCDGNGWDFAAYALYLKSAYGEVLPRLSSTNAAHHTSLHSLTPDWGWGFKFDASYHFNTGNDFILNWSHYGKMTSHRVLFGTEPNLNLADTELRPKWDVLNAEFGQRVDFGAFKNIRFHGGLQYTRIGTHYHANLDQVFMKYNGVGPRVGTDFGYAWGNGLAVYLNSAAAVLAGDKQFNIVTDGTLDVAGASSTLQKNTIVPVLDFKLGAKYTYVLAQSDLTLDLGYLWLNYFQAQVVRTTSGLGGSGAFALRGPYIGLKYMGYV